LLRLGSLLSDTLTHSDGVSACRCRTSRWLPPAYSPTVSFDREGWEVRWQQVLSQDPTAALDGWDVLIAKERPRLPSGVDAVVVARR
jgi:hypothetical protein